ncbi:RNase P/RNase MRP complex subunit KNAG_0E02700 [Huiozyma naganishii CBS 8797]|uniref:Ribonuclease P protein subunit n=1 Tax=Huiozyma naganishii (strain ATCC MYA-139 / BCRC 22969 / CBS 8797 / KCTC 17520 / NBRC 10181 / NCYC 3082 / Yp74L-3) TaxID=1071383 RepID=J7S6R8_HUIN7|nr:hypothetical protein KNAG_0E02700 [Kazachstania naganishii CBS 8797]CCK70529.1 hypothetical protein KNAG_0E02700 [Kazachstania naganishii CBS 8797]
MDRAQEFIKSCLFTKSFINPDKPIEENRLRETLLVLPTDGGLSSRLKHNRSKLKLTAENITSTNNKIRHPNYKSVSKNAKIAMKAYITGLKRAVQRAKKTSYENDITEKQELELYLKENNPELWSQLPHYGEFEPMHKDLWVGYIKELLGLPVETAIEDTSKLSINGSAALLKLSMAEYNGCLIKVAKSRNKNMVGIRGIVIWDSQKHFIIVTQGKLTDEVKCIPKQGTVFNFQIPLNDTDALEYSILGDRFKYRSSDRAGRKFKSRRCDDMLYYITDL